MRPLLDFLKRLLDMKTTIKNAVSLLVALVSVSVFYFTSKDSQWFEDLDEYGLIGVGVSLSVVFLIGFLSAWLIYSGLATRRQRVASHRAALERAEQEIDAVRRNLDSLTPWQRTFLLRFIVERRTQIPDYEVGGYKAVWGSEMAVLVSKGIVKEHPQAGVYEIEPVYDGYLKQNWNPDTGGLS